MTDIERAKEYCNNEVPFDTTESGEKLYTENDLKQAYLAGLKAGKDMNVPTKWHDLRKNPDDLPESSIFHEVVNQNGIKMYYDDVFKKWNMYYDGIIVQAQIPIAWCEIPKFER